MNKKHDHQSVVEFLRKYAEMVGEFPSQYLFVLEHGWAYRPIPLPPEMTVGEPQQCFYNATVRADGALYYCEGYVFTKARIPILHAWLTDGKGNAIEVTLREPGSAYVGVPFNADFVFGESVRKNYIGTLIDNWEDDYPVLRAWKNPDEWFEPAGAGFAKLQK